VTKRILLALAGLAPAILNAQSPEEHPRIEVATVKLNTSGVGRGMSMNPGRFTIRNSSVRTLLLYAYKVQAYAISDGPGWIDSDHYDIEAKVEGQLTGAAALNLVRTILEDRFHLKVHRETKDGPVYFLTVATNGPKLKPATCAVIDPAYKPAPPAPGESRPDRCGTNRSRTNGTSRTLDILGVKIDEPDMAIATFPGLTFYFASILERRVIDKTGLTGRFDINLEYTPASTEIASPAESAAPSLFAAVQEQIGLKLESGKGPVELLVVDHLEKPSAN
jgi:uncharacterized protein (TIGR03435 family)